MIYNSIMKTFCFKLYNSKHNDRLMRLISIAGLIYNHCIALHKRYYRLYGKHIHKFRLINHIVKLKRTNKFSYFRKLDAQAIQDIVFRIDIAYKLFWGNLKRGIKTAPPKFRKVRRYRSFTLYLNGWKLDEEHGRIRIQKKWYRYFNSRKIEGKIKTITVKRDALGDIYIYLTCDNQCDMVEPRTGESVGLDFGLGGSHNKLKFLTASNGRDIASPDFFAQNAVIIRKKCRIVSRRQKGSGNRIRAYRNLVRAYRKMFNQRKDFHFKTARRLCEEYALICLETLDLKAIGKNWGRKINSLGFYSFIQILMYEAQKAGTRIFFADRYYPSSQICSECGYKNPELKDVRIRSCKCPNCGTEHDRDRNAAINILRAGVSAYGGELVRPVSAGKVR